MINYPALCALFDAPSASALSSLCPDSAVEWDRLNLMGTNPKLRSWQAAALPAALCAVYARQYGVIATRPAS